MSRLFKPKGRSVYCIEFYYNKKRFSRSLRTKSKSLARRLQQQIDEGIARGTLDPDNLFQKPRSENEIGSFLDDYLAYLESRSAAYSDRTIETYRTSVNLFRVMFGSGKVSDITPRYVDSTILPTLENHFPSMATVKHHVVNFRTVFGFAVKWGLITKNPFAGKVPRLEKKQPVYYKEHEIRRIIEYFDARPDWTRTYFLLMLDTGMRKTEQFELTWDQVYLDQQFPVVRPIAKKRERTVPLNALGVKMLREADRRLGEDRVFWQIETISGVNKAWQVARKKLKMSYRIHNFRSNFATWFVINGGSIAHLMDIMGWESYETAKVYRAVASEFLEQNSNRVDFLSMSG